MGLIFRWVKSFRFCLGVGMGLVVKLVTPGHEEYSVVVGGQAAGIAWPLAAEDILQHFCTLRRPVGTPQFSSSAGRSGSEIGQPTRGGQIQRDLHCFKHGRARRCAVGHPYGIKGGEYRQVRAKGDQLLRIQISDHRGAEPVGTPELTVAALAEWGSGEITNAVSNRVAAMAGTRHQAGLDHRNGGAVAGPQFVPVGEKYTDVV